MTKHKAGCQCAYHTKLPRRGHKPKCQCPWCTGRTKHDPDCKCLFHTHKPFEELLKTAERRCKEGKQVSAGRLVRRLINEQVFEELCAECDMGPVWQGKPLVLQLDHINGDRTNWGVGNLRLLCPNCHTQTPTYCKQKKLQTTAKSEGRSQAVKWGKDG